MSKHAQKIDGIADKAIDGAVRGLLWIKGKPFSAAIIAGLVVAGLIAAAAVFG